MVVPWTRLTRGQPTPRDLHPTAGLKPTGNRFRRMLPFGSPKREETAQPNEAKRRRRRVLQVDPPDGGTDARAPPTGTLAAISRRPGFGSYMAGTTKPVSIPPPTALCEAVVRVPRFARATRRSSRLAH